MNSALFPKPCFISMKWKSMRIFLQYFIDAFFNVRVIVQRKSFQLVSDLWSR